ncbi:unnamed protein product [Boreogadus saida]
MSLSWPGPSLSRHLKKIHFGFLRDTGVVQMGLLAGFLRRGFVITGCRSSVPSDEPACGPALVTQRRQVTALTHHRSPPPVPTTGPHHRSPPPVPTSALAGAATQPLHWALSRDPEPHTREGGRRVGRKQSIKQEGEKKPTKKVGGRDETAERDREHMEKHRKRKGEEKRKENGDEERE